MMHFIHSNRMELLCEKLMACIDDYQRSDFESQNDAFLAQNIFEPTNVLVQSPGMAQWLKLKLADKTGLCANIDFPLPSTYIWSLYQQYFDNLPNTSAFTKDNLVWKVMAILPSQLTRPEFETLRIYLGELNNQQKLFQLCTKIADVYDQYLMYRPDWIQQWESGNDMLKDVDVRLQAWQPILWREIIAYSDELAESPYHRANMHNALIEKLEQRTMSTTPIFIFGMSTVPTSQLDVFSTLAETAPVYFFWLNPSEHFWADIIDERQMAKKQLTLMLEPNEADSHAMSLYDVGNPLLASWGKVGRDFLFQVMEKDIQQEDAFDCPEPSSLLHWVQNDIFSLDNEVANDSKSRMVEYGDKSIQVNVAHSPIRELEILKSRLYHWLHTGVIESVDDVIVMMPDVSTYAPFIDVVFATDSDSYNGIPYAISDRSFRQEYGITEGFMFLLNLHKKRLTFNEIFSLFELQPILNKFSVSQDEAKTIKQWCHSVNVRWGLDGEDKHRFDLLPSAENTWLFGMERLLAGYSCGSEEEIFGVLAYPDIEGQITAALGNFLEFLSAIQTTLVGCQTDTCIKEKVTFAEQILSRFFDDDEEYQFIMSEIRNALASVSEHQSQYPQDITQDVFVQAMEGLLENKGVGQRFLTGKVNFTTLMPMRSIPFNQVCLLGMNDIDYPRQVTPIGFDLVQYSKSRKGDRARRMDDRYLFLEALISARKGFYVSYVGHSERDNSIKNPSILVTELLEYCDEHFSINWIPENEESDDKQVSDAIVSHFPLQPFAEQNFSLQPSYDGYWHSVASSINRDPESPPFLNLSPHELLAYIKEATLCNAAISIEAGEIIKFLRNPVAYYFRHRWQTQFSAPSDTSDDAEPLELTKLDAYWLGNEFFYADKNQVEHKWRLRGQLPAANFGKQLSSSIASEMNNLIDDIQNTFGLDLSSVESCIQLVSFGDIEVRSRFDIIEDNQNVTVVLMRPGRLRLLDHLHLFIQLNLFALSDEYSKSGENSNANKSTRGIFIATDKKLVLESPDKGDARQYLEQLVRLLEVGKTIPIPFFHQTAQHWVKKYDKESTIASFTQNDFVVGEGLEKHTNRVYPNLELVFDVFTDLVEKIVLPALDAEVEQ